MSIVYAKFEVSLHGMDLPDAGDMLRLETDLRAAVLAFARNKGWTMRGLDGDVEVELIESAGRPAG